MFDSRKKTLFFIITASFIAGMLFAGGLHLAGDFFSAWHGVQIPGSTDQDLLPGTGPDMIAEVVVRSSPAVVRISTKVASSGSNPFFSDPFFRQFFGIPARPKEEEGLGSGFIISKEGFILTNAHVIDGASTISVTVTGLEKELEARVIGADHDLDLALLKIDAGKDLPTLSLGNSDQIKVGNWVIAIGNPYGLDHTVTTGVISAKGRPISVNDRHYENLLQTDASINPGNSGGPLLNLSGEVVGINTAINAQAQGIGFAIPTSTVSGVLEELKSSMNQVRPWIGVQVQNADRKIAAYLGLEKAEGVVVTGVVPASPAEKAGIGQGDVIVEYNGIKVNTLEDLDAAIRESQVGHKVKVLVVHRRQVNPLIVSVADKPYNVR